MQTGTNLLICHRDLFLPALGSPSLRRASPGMEAGLDGERAVTPAESPAQG